MKWTDIHVVVASLNEAHAEADPKAIRFTDLHRWVLDLPGFGDDPRRCNEKILEAIQMAWIEEKD